ncbi:MAG: DNA polymerase III subunit chi [Rubrivivax sp.]|jgi:DNA polymerase-3 subunit chi|nr:DNA polymerase III subunit chi [Rubrivivax sp.]MBK7262015.1 DNA polymerase III subunit chi [Rubrivivax sp.]MBK8528225.1 DNA polymerase III subunit chi [Rubrivivax sp.]
MAPRVEFHTGVADEVGFACRLLRKAYHQGARVLVRAPSARLARLDRELWTFVEREFLPHLRFAAPGPVPAAAARTPLWLVDGELPAPCPPVLVNLGADMPSSLQGLTRIIEIVASDVDDEQQGRERWRAYKAAGLELIHHTGAASADDDSSR